MQFIDLQAQYRHLQGRIDSRIAQVLAHGNYILGPEVDELEHKLAEYVGVKHCITCANGTDALQLALMALDIGPGDAVFCPTFTFFATAEVVPLVGASPVFVDVDPQSYNISPADLRARIARTIKDGELKPKAIIAVDLFGQPADYPQLSAIAEEFGLLLIEDSAQGFGGTLKGKRAGSFGHVATTSFFPAKPLGCYGDGGALFTDQDSLADMLRSLRLHGKGQHKYDNVRIGLNSRLDTLQAAILLEKLAAFPAELDRRNQVAAAYGQAAKGRFDLPWVAPQSTSSWAQYCLLSEDRAAVMEKLKQSGIPTAIYYQTCMHQQSVFKDRIREDEHFPVAEKLAEQIFSLPMHGYMSDDELLQITAAISA